MSYDKIVLISIPVSDLQTIILDCVTIALKNNVPPDPANHVDIDRWMNLTELCSYLPDKPSKATVYSWVHYGQIPNHKGKKKLRFLKSEIDTWLIQERRKTVSEIKEEADQYIAGKK